MTDYYPLIPTVFNGFFYRSTDYAYFWMTPMSTSMFKMSPNSGSETKIFGVNSLGFVSANSGVVTKSVMLYDTSVADPFARVVAISSFDVTQGTQNTYSYYCDRMVTMNGVWFISEDGEPSQTNIPYTPALTLPIYFRENSGALWRVDESNPYYGYFKLTNLSDSRAATAICGYDPVQSTFHILFQFYDSATRSVVQTRLHGATSNSFATIVLDNGDTFTGTN
ncbi:hypothetical protein C9374_000808 [Naegleria lovaniensis]|uniref:Uncharacterized protein n=1 Tax=Naegleria lovaniensis TaxID=51637 RepID=A0AA88GYG2_NAELO|nr:uncharacterized protein C9374_000808 [Naegleria lovaniensis]KAG2387958.1 hypothetical protein C9374_000808 [Naegleria lovaniensis]